MGLQDRVHSLETEYAITFFAEDGNAPGSGDITDMLMEMVGASHGVPGSVYLLNGSKLAHDVGHAEWSQPECRSARELAVYDKAADYLLIDSVVPRAERAFRRAGYVGRLAVVKNNEDSFGTTYGCHENYQMLRDAELLADGDFVRYMVQVMVPFLVSRPVLAGSGRLVVDDDRPGDPVVRYELSQRAAFIERVVSGDTTRARPIFNLGREGESFTAGDFRRVHLVMGDANMSGWATWIKLGSTGLMLRMIEDLFFDAVPVLHNPVAALRTICGDLTGTVTVPLQTGGEVSALDLQWTYYDLADRYLTLFGASGEDEDLMEAWGRALEDLEQDPALLRDRADWAIKKHLLDTFLQNQGCTLESLPPDGALLADLRAFDLRYHELTGRGLYTRLYQPDTLVTWDEITRAQESGPPHTRARVRGETIRLGRVCGLDVRANGWMDVTIEGEPISIDDPLAFDVIRLAAWDRPCRRLAAKIAEAPDDARAHARLGRCYRGVGRTGAALAALRAAAEQEPKDSAIARDLAETCLLAGQYDDAAHWYERAQQLANKGDKTAGQIALGLGDARRYRGDLDAALVSYRRAARGTDEAADLSLGRIAGIHLAQGDTENARTGFRKALEGSVERLIPLVGLGAIHLSRGQRDQATEFFERAVALSPLRAGYDLAPEAVAILRALALVGLGRAEGVAQLTAALADPPPAAAAGVWLLQPLADLFEQANPPLAGWAEIAVLVADRSLPTRAPAPPDPSPLAARRIDWLRAALTAPGVAIREAALTYWGWRATADPAAPVVVALLPLVLDRAHHDPVPAVRRAAVGVLGTPGLSGSELTEEVIACLHDPSPAVRWAAQTALERLNSPGQQGSGMTEVVVAVTGSPPDPAQEGG